jgi:hypothetical protein
MTAFNESLIPEERYFPDANSTRVTYGQKFRGYSPEMHMYNPVGFILSSRKYVPEEIII